MIKHVKEIDSTSKYLTTHPDEFENLDVLSASHQTDGVGRSGHVWLDNMDDNILFSVMVKDVAIINSYKQLSISLGSILFNYLTRYISETRVSMKWPNDVYVDDNKICGTLLQGRLPDYVVIGIGININQKQFGELKNTTSLSLETGHDFNVETLRKELIGYIVDELHHFSNNREHYLETFNNHDYLKNKEVSYNNVVTGKDEKGIALGINNEGELKVRRGRGIVYISSSEVQKIH